LLVCPIKSATKPTGSFGSSKLQIVASSLLNAQVQEQVQVPAIHNTSRS